MKLKVLKTISKRVITLELETTGFTQEENKMLDILGEPMVEFNKSYEKGFDVSINRKIRSGFKTKVKFDGSNDIILADEVSDIFLEELPEEMAKVMDRIKMLYDDIDGQNENKPPRLIDIKY